MSHPQSARSDWKAYRTEVAEAPIEKGFLTQLQSLDSSVDLDALHSFRATCSALDLVIRENNRDEHLPRLRRWDGQGTRIETVDFHPSYHQIGRAVYGTGVMSRYRTPGKELETLALTYLLAQNGEAGHTCPLACTAGLIKILQTDDPTRHAAWLERLLDPNYDTHFHGAQFLTEAQGGSDVGANAVTARQEGTHWFIHGEKWFCSVIDAHLFLLTARPDGQRTGTGGLKAFVVPRLLPDGTVNHFAIRRLKYKLGTRSMASAEVDFQGAQAVEVGDFRRVVQVVLNTSRLYNAVCSAGMLTRAAREAHAYARNRRAFGQPILRFPTLARIVAGIRTEAAAARSLTFELAALSDQITLGQASEEDALAWRILVNLNKFWTAQACTSGIRDAIEVLGGNGAIEEFSVLPRLLRDSIVCEAWEGGHNVLCAQVLRDAQRTGLHRPMFTWLSRLHDSDALRQMADRWDALVAMPTAEAAVYIRDLCEDLRPVAQAAALLARSEDAHAQTAAAHLLTTQASGYRPIDDAGLMSRVEALVA